MWRESSSRQHSDQSSSSHDGRIKGKGKGKEKRKYDRVWADDCISDLSSLLLDRSKSYDERFEIATNVMKVVRYSSLHQDIISEFESNYSKFSSDLREFRHSPFSSSSETKLNKHANSFFQLAETHIYNRFRHATLSEIGLSMRPDRIPKDAYYMAPTLIDKRHLVHYDCHFFCAEQPFIGNYTDGNHQEEIVFKKDRWNIATDGKELCVVYEATAEAEVGGIYHFFTNDDLEAFAEAHAIDRERLKRLVQGENMHNLLGNYYNVTSGDIDRFQAAGIPIIKEQNVGSHERSSHQSQSLALETSFGHLEISPSDNVPQTSPYDYPSSYQGTEGVIESQFAPYSEHFQIPSSSADAGPSWYAPIEYNQSSPFQSSPTHFSPTEDTSQIPSSVDIPSTQYMGEHQEKEHYEGEQHKARRRKRRKQG